MKKSKQHERNGGYSTASVQNIINLDITKPIDVETAANALEGHIKLYLNLLSKFEVTSLHKNMAKMVICIE